MSAAHAARRQAPAGRPSWADPGIARRHRGRPTPDWPRSTTGRPRSGRRAPRTRRRGRQPSLKDRSVSSTSGPLGPTRSTRDALMRSNEPPRLDRRARPAPRPSRWSGRSSVQYSARSIARGARKCSSSLSPSSNARLALAGQITRWWMRCWTGRHQLRDGRPRSRHVRDDLQREPTRWRLVDHRPEVAPVRVRSTRMMVRPARARRPPMVRSDAGSADPAPASISMRPSRTGQPIDLATHRGVGEVVRVHVGRKVAGLAGVAHRECDDRLAERASTSQAGRRSGPGPRHRAACPRIERGRRDRLPSTTSAARGAALRPGPSTDTRPPASDHASATAAVRRRSTAPEP